MSSFSPKSRQKTLYPEDFSESYLEEMLPELGTAGNTFREEFGGPRAWHRQRSERTRGQSPGHTQKGRDKRRRVAWIKLRRDLNTIRVELFQRRKQMGPT